MDNVQITHVEGEPPIYREMKRVSLTLESCILNSEEDFMYNQTEQTLIAQDNCDDGELSAEEITSMIMINEGPNALSSVQEELEANKINLSLRNSSNIKEILTCDLPKSGRFLSTKSLQGLSGAKKKPHKRNLKFANEEETDVDDSSSVNVKKLTSKNNRAVKENFDKTGKDKNKKIVKPEKLKVKSLKRGNSLEKISSEKKAVKTVKKPRLNKNNDFNSTSKVFKKKVPENIRVSKKKVEESDSAENAVIKTPENEKKKSIPEKKPTVSRSGRSRRITDLSHYVLSKNKEGKILNPGVDQKTVQKTMEETEKLETGKKPVDSNSKFENGKENKSQGDLLQNALSESVESWFDISSTVEKKGKRTRGKVKIIPKDSDAFFEETEIPQVDKTEKTTTTTTTSEPVSSVTDTNDKSTEAEKVEEEIVSSAENVENLDCMKENLEDVAGADAKTEEGENPKSDVTEPFTVNEDKMDDVRNVATLKGKKVKPANRQLLGYKRKRRKVRNITVSSYLKNYGERIDFGVDLGPEDESKKQSVTEKDVTEKPKTLQEPVVSESSDIVKKKDRVVKSADPDKPAGATSKTHKTRSLKRSLSAESLQIPRSTKSPTPTEDNSKVKSESCFAELNDKGTEEFTDDQLNMNVSEQEEAVKEKTVIEKQSEEVIESKKEEVIESKMEEVTENKTGQLTEGKIEKVTESGIEKVTDSKKEEEEGKQRISEDDFKSDELKDKQFKVRKEIKRKRMNVVNTRVFGMKNKRKRRWNCGRPINRALKTAANYVTKKKPTEEPKNPDDSKSAEESLNVQENKENDKDLKSQTEKHKVTGESFTSSSVLSIPLKKRPRRSKGAEALDEIGKENKEETNSEKPDCERRKSHREIKLTPKIVDMIATSFSHKRSRKVSSCKEETVVKEVKEVKEEPSSIAEKAREGPETETEAKGGLSEQPLAAVPSVENYLQSKMEANASTFESSWEPGDLVWARFAGNPFWPALILRDPFSNDEYSRIKYLGRLPRPFVHVQFLADFGRRAWGPELYIMNFNGLEEFEKLKANLPEVNAFTQRKDLVYQQAFFTSKKMKKHWMDGVKEAEALIAKSKDERITYMKIKYPLVKYAASVANGRLVPNERTKCGDSKSPQSKGKRKRKGLSGIETTGDWPGKENEEAMSKDTFECVNTSDMDEGIKKSEKESPKITLKLVRSPKKGAKRKSSKSVNDFEEKKMKKRIKKEPLEEDYLPSDSGSNGEKGMETTTGKQKKYFLFKGAKTEKVCQICIEILENEKTVKCRGVCQGLFHKSCADKMSSDLPPVKEGMNLGVKYKRRKKLFAEGDGDNSTDSQSKEPAEKEWRCNDCLRGENPCFVCNSRSGNRQRCCVAHCGKFYHQKCLKLYPQTVYNQGAPIRKWRSLQQTKTAESESPHYQILSCPLHVCHTCASDNPADFNMKYLSEKLVKCIKCPSAYHGGNYCVPAGSTILNTTQIICAKHGDPGKKSHVNISWCFICNMGGTLICCEWCPSSFHLDCLNIKPPDGPYICEECESGRFPLYGEVVWVKLGRYRWWPARVLFPQEILPNIMALPHKPWEFAVRFYGSNDHYWLNRGRVFLYQEGDSEQKFKGQSYVDKIYQRAVQEATKDYFAIQEERKSRLLGTNTSGIMKPPPYVKIKTNKAVGKVQLGNVSQSEPQTCDCDPNTEAPCSSGSVCLNRMLLVECNPNYCNAGSRCENQSFEKREYPPLEPYRTQRRGWGLRSSIDIPKGSFIIEYVGEVVDDEEFKRRMKRKQETKDSNYYFLTIDKDRMIDAGPKGNLARFMNHSCSPNCETQKWTVNGDTRVGLFALRDIPAGTELTFNYNLDCAGNEKKPCYCEEENCSGFIGVKAKNDKSEALKNKLAKRLEKESEDECFVCNDGGELMVCDVPNCPKVYHMECVNLTEWPNELWFCPRHMCSLCNRTTKRCCRLCTTAYCFAHLDNNMFPDNQGGLLCSKHSTCAVKPAQIFRKASYVNRNTPVEYEKPFVEKYRPPPQKERNSPEESKEEILMEPNLTDNTPIVVENPLLSPATPSCLTDGVSVQVLYVDEEGQIVGVDGSTTPNPEETISNACEKEKVPKPFKRKKRTNIPRKKLNPPVAAGETENKPKSPTQGGINFESLMIKSVEDKILDSKLNIDNIYNIIGGGGGGGGGGEGEGEAGQSETDGAERCIRDDSNDLKTDTVNKKEEAEVDRSRRSKYFKIITPEKFIKVTESDSNQKKVTDFNYIEFMHPLRSARSKTKVDENTRK